jgi:hypothetical protein
LNRTSGLSDLVGYQSAENAVYRAIIFSKVGFARFSLHNRRRLIEEFKTTDPHEETRAGKGESRADGWKDGRTIILRTL